MKLLSYLLLMLWAISMFGCGSGSNDGSNSISAPKVVSITPLNGASNVSRIGDIVVSFDQSIDPNTVEAMGFNVKDDQNYQVEADAVVVNSNEVTFKPKHRLPAGRSYTITIAPTVKSIFGVAMSAEYTSAFTSKTSEWNSTENFGQATHAVTAIDKHGNMIIVWWRYNSTNGHYEIVMSQLHGGIWSDPQVISGNATNVYHPGVAMDNNGNAIIVWEDWGTGRGVVKTEFRAGAWSQPEVITAPGVSFSPGSSPSVTMNDQGRAAIVWSQSNIYKKEYANGAWSAPSAVSTGGSCSDPRVSLNSKSNIAVTWHYRDGYNSHSKVFSRVCLDGAWNDAAIVSVAGTDPDSFYHLAFDSNDNAMVVWAQWEGTIRRAYRNEYLNGSWAGPVPLSSQGAESNYPTVAMDNRGNAIIAWQQRIDNIWQIVISESRTGVWNAPTQASSSVTSADVPVVKMDSSGNGILLWNQASGADWQVYRMQYLNGVWTEKSVMAVSNNQLNHVSCDIATDGSGDTGIVWSQSDGASWNLYRTFYHSDDSNYSSAVGTGSPSGGYSGGFSGGGAGGTGESSINVSNWYWLNPKTSGNNLGNVAYGAGKYVAIGNAGVIATSTDGSRWTLQNSGTSVKLRRVVYGGGMFVAVGSYGTVLSSTDGVTWQPQTSGTTSNLTGAVYNSGQFAVVGDSGTILTSPDGGAWTNRTSGTTNSLLDVTYGKNQYVISGSAGLILTSSDGVTWSSRDSRSTIVLNGVAYGGGLFVAVGNAGTVQTSPDGINWATQAAASVTMPGFSVKPSFVAVTHDGAQFVAVGLSGVVQTSPNGINWTSRSSGTLNNLNGVNNVGGQTMAAGDSGTILAALDRNSWTGTSGSTDKLSSVIFSGSQFLTAGWSGGIGIIRAPRGGRS